MMRLDFQNCYYTYEWAETALSDLTTNDVFVIVGTVSSTSYSMSNNSSGNPAASSVSISNQRITSSVDDNIIWKFSGNSTDGYTFHPYGTNTTWLYCNTSNSNLRVGNGNDANRKLYVAANNTLKTNDNSTAKYLNVYTNGPDWRAYASNSTSTNVKYYRRQVVVPTITVPTTSLTNFTYSSGNGPSEPQSFTVSGVNLSANLSIAAPTHYELRQGTDGSWTNSISLTPSSGTVSSTTIYARLKSGLSIGNYNSENVNITSTGATAKTVSLSGSVSGYTLTYNGNGNTGGSVPTDATAYEKNASVTILGNTGSLVKTHYDFVGWTRNIGNTPKTYVAGDTLIIKANTTVNAVWTPTTHIFNTAISPANSGTVDAKNGNNETVASGSAVAETSQLTLTATPSENYRFTSWSVSGTGSTVAPNNASPATFTMGTADATATANFTRIYTITCATGLTNGSISADLETAAAGETVKITASPADGYILSTITVTKDGGGTIDAANINNPANHAEFAMPTDNVTVSATFTEVYHVTYNANEAESGTVPTDNTNYTSANNTVTVKGNTGNLARTGYDFGGWNTQADGNGTNYLANATFQIASNTTLYAKWVPGTYTVAVSSVDNVTITARYGENSIAEGSSASVLIGTEVSLCADGLASGKAIVWDVCKTGETSTKVTVTDNKFVVPAYGVTISGTVGDLFEKYTSTIAAGDYVIYSNGAAMKNSISSDRFVNQTQNISIDGDNLLINDATTTANITWQVAANGDYWTLYNASVKKYAGGTSTKNQGALLDEVTDYAKWSVEVENGSFDFINLGRSSGSDPNNKYLRKNGNSGWACYATGQSAKPYLYKKVNSYQLDVASVENGTIAVSVSGLSDIAEGANANVRSGATVTLIATPDANYVNNPWTVYKTGYPETTVTVENNQFSMPEYPVTVSTSFRSANTVTLTYSENGVVSSSDVTEGEITLKNASQITIPAGYTFVGWSASPNDFSAIYNGTYMLSGNTTLYAVFSIDMPTDFSFEINTSDFVTGGYDGNNNEKTTVAEAVTGETLSVKWTSYQVMQINSAMQWQKDYGYIYNSTNLGTVKSVVVTSTAGTFTTYYGTSAQPSSGAAEAGKGYFKTSVGSVTGTTSKVTVTFAKNTPHYFTRVFGNETATADIEINGPSIIPSGSSLNMGDYALTNGTAANLIIEDGGQLKFASAGAKDGSVQATVQKDIAAWTEGTTDGWYFIASPINVNNLNPSTVTNMLPADEGSGDNIIRNYDLYWLEDVDPIPMWRNYRNTSFNLANGQGYLYARREAATLEFAGAVKPYDANNTITITAGWNLVGNPYTFNAYPNHAYYTISNANTGITAQTATSSAAVAPCTGIIVKAVENGSIKFLDEAPVGAANNGNLQMTLSQTAATRGGNNTETLDNAIVSFNEGTQLEKFYFGEQSANIFIPQGNEEYAIVSSNAQGEMPVNFKAYVAGEYTITVNPEEVEMDYLHLIDNIAGNDVDLLTHPSYTFNASNDDYPSRFRLVFSAINNGNDNDNENFAFISNGQIILTTDACDASLQVIDMMGRIVSTEQVNGNSIRLANLAKGVYVLRLVGNKVKTQKIVVE